MLKLVLFLDNDRHTWLKHMPQIVYTNKIEDRIQLAKYIEEHCIDHSNRNMHATNEDMQTLRENPGIFLCVSKIDDHYLYETIDDNGNVSCISIYEVDEAKKWKIEEHNGLEQITYSK